jgi:uncharacterized protein (DUF952 family)
MYSFKSKFSISPEQMAKTYTFLATSDQVKNVSGQHFDEKNNTVKLSTYSTNKVNIDAVVKLTNSYL